MSMSSPRNEASSAITAGPSGRSTASSAHSADPPLVLFVGRSNASCSIMAEAILTHLAQGRVRAASAGALPHGVSPYALQCLRDHGIATQGLRSKLWGEFFGLYASPVRFLIALGDVYAARAHWPEDTLIGRWDMPDPAAVVGSDLDIRVAFEGAFETLKTRIQTFLALPFGQLTDQALLQELARIGELR